MNTFGSQVTEIRETVSSLRPSATTPIIPWDANVLVANQYSAMKQTLREAREASQDLVANIGRLGGECFEGSSNDLKAAVLRTSNEKLLPLHRIVATLYFLSLAVGAYTFIQWMMRPVIKFW